MILDMHLVANKPKESPIALLVGLLLEATKSSAQKTRIEVLININNIETEKTKFKYEYRGYPNSCLHSR
jgi:hypothetical protein